ncbi:hypothetical protein DRO29_07125 [Candidatus Bathyarchaeota archaeon]|nr:MAG: hypothetical protein DRO29_07125 [Candidatus Bathyarchaeota archaeon]
MVRIYLDIETYRPKKEDAFIHEKVIAIGILEDWTPYSPNSLNEPIEPQLFTEWELGSEKIVVEDFYKYLKGIFTDEVRFVVVVGFNILRMDIPLLIQKGLWYKVATIDELNFLWHNTLTIDFFQSLLPANKYMFKGLRMPRVFKVIRDELGIVNAPQLEEHGEEIAKAYEGSEYMNIEKWLKQDLYAIRYLDLSGIIPRLIELSIRKGEFIFK